jgi:hypothetical protein
VNEPRGEQPRNRFDLGGGEPWESGLARTRGLGRVEAAASDEDIDTFIRRLP